MSFSQSRFSQSQQNEIQRFSQSQANYEPTQIKDITARKSNSYNEEDEELSKKADECVQYILLCCLSDRKVIVKRADLNKHVLKDHSRQYKTIIRMVEVRLDEVFGIELTTIDNSGDIEKCEKVGLRNKFEFDLELNRPVKSDHANTETDLIFNDQLKYSMLMIALSLIFMNENEINADLFWDLMKKLDINREEKKHKYLGDINKYFTSDLVKEGYLEHDAVKGIDPPTFKFRAGYKAKLEITKKSLLEFVCKVYGGLDVCSPSEWSTQYADAMKELKEEGDDEDMELTEEQSMIQSNTQYQTQRSTRSQR